MLTDYHAKYFAYELTRRFPSDSVQKLVSSLSDAQVDLNPHQVEAALFAFQSPLSKGALLADEVGLGKTIEAGIVLAQKWAERKRKILIILPSNLRKQWNQELHEKFFLPSLILETKSFNQEVKKGNLNPFIQNEIVICSYQFARLKEQYIQQIEWDLVVIDEAHRLRNVYKVTNKISNSIKKSTEGSHKILLTATPLQNSLLELYGLVSFIDEYTFGDLKSFKNQFARLNYKEDIIALKERIKPICQRTLRRQVLEYVNFTNRIPITQEFIPSELEQKLYNLVSDYLQRDSLYALPASQRKLMTLILRKLLASSTFAIAGTLEGLANKLSSIIEQHEKKLINIEETDLCIDIDNFDEYLDEWSEDVDEKIPVDEYELTDEDIAKIKQEIEVLQKSSELAKNISKNEKGNVLLTALQRGFAETSAKGGKNKAIIFTESTRTQAYIKGILESTDYKDKIVLFNGSNSDKHSQEIYHNWLEKHKNTDMITGSKSADIRAALVEYFKEEATIMIATEAAAEGINLQFCSLVVNYDLPWNPQRIEQRIGRCHRYGQKNDVVVVNFLNKKNEADQRVFELLSEKFKLFEGVFGASDEVLGSIESGVDFEKRIANIYLKCRTDEEIRAEFDALRKEMELQIDEKMSQTRQKLLENFDEEVLEKLKVNLIESRDYITKFENWLWELTKHYLRNDAIFNGEELSFYLKSNPFPNEKIHSGPYKIGKNITEANIYRIGHPLAQKIISNYKNIELPTAELIFDLSNLNRKISILDNLIGKSGVLSVYNLTIDTFEAEDYIIFCGITDDGTQLDYEQCQRMFSLSSDVIKNYSEIDSNIQMTLNDILSVQVEAILNTNSTRNGSFFEQEMDKLDKWAEDLKNSMEIEIKELDIEIKSLKTEAKKIAKLEEKVKAQRHIKELEKKRNEKRQALYKSQDEVEQRKDDLISEIEARLKQKIQKNRLFEIKWKIK